MKGLTVEFFLCVLACIIVGAFYFVSAWIKSRTHMLHTGLLAAIMGAMMVFLGWWGADAAFCTIMNGGQTLDIPLMRTYTALEWWNINWFVTTIGAVLLALGTFIIGKASK